MRIFGILCLALLVSVVATAKTKFGSGADFNKVIPISKILKTPSQYVDKEVTVAGEVKEVCEMKGCWMELKSDEKLQTLRIKVDDGFMVFPLSSRGKKAAAQGILKRKSLNKKQAIAHYKHIAEEQGHKFDPKSVKGPMTFYQVRASGVTIQ